MRSFLLGPFLLGAGLREFSRVVLIGDLRRKCTGLKYIFFEVGRPCR